MHTVLNTSTNESFNLENNETIFEGFSRSGVELPHGCLAGSCGACLIYLDLKEMKKLNEPKTIEKNTLDDIRKHRNIDASIGIRLSCRARALGDLSFRVSP